MRSLGTYSLATKVWQAYDAAHNLSSLPVFNPVMQVCKHNLTRIKNILNVFILVHVTFLAADACLSWSLPSVTEQRICPHRFPMQYWLKNHWPDQAFFKHSSHTNCISNSVKIVAKWFLCMRTREEKNGVAKEAIVLQWVVRTASWNFKRVKAIGWCTAQWKCC